MDWWARNQTWNIKSAFVTAGSAVGGPIGAIVAAAVTAVAQLKSSEGSTLHQFIYGHHSASNCEVIGVAIPENATVLGVTYWVNPIDKMSIFETVANRNERWCKWEPFKVFPAEAKDGSKFQAVFANFKNWSRDHPRLAAIAVGYEVREQKGKVTLSPAAKATLPKNKD